MKKMPPKGSIKEEGVIKQGSIAQFMRKRTQLVGFDFGLYKHTQYAIEFMDNSLDAIESFQWKSRRNNPAGAFKLKDDVLLENFSYLKGGINEEDFNKFAQDSNASESDEEIIIDDVPLDEAEDVDGEGDEGEEGEGDEGEEGGGNEGEEGGGDVGEEGGGDEDEDGEGDESEHDVDEEEKNLAKYSLDEKELEIEVVNIMNRVADFISPIKLIVDREPFLIYKLSESEAPSIYADASQSSEDTKLYTLQIFDNGTGMSPDDLEKFGKYLASSKSVKLKQTRGSQGFGSPSAFSDAQNTTGQPVKVVSKHSNTPYGICSEFYTTSKNKKSYVVPPTQVDCPFKHGTYIELKYLNVKYIRGYVDNYIKRTALTNPHVNLIFIDPKNVEEIYTRKVDRFPKEPTYAKPHPSSVNIGDFQDIMRNSANQTISACLQENYVRMSSSLAKRILDEAESELERRLQIFNLGSLKGPFISWNYKTTEPIYIIKNDKRIFGRNKKPRDIFITYLLKDEENIQRYWQIVKPFNDLMRNSDRIEKKIRSTLGKIKENTPSKEKTALKKEINGLKRQLKSVTKQITATKKDIIRITNGFKVDSQSEVDNEKIQQDMRDKIKELLISKTKPRRLSQVQTESLFKAFRAQSYMAPPKDPAVPIGASILETTLMKEFNLSLSYRTDLFEDTDEKLPKLDPAIADRYVSRILSKFIKPPYYNPETPLLKDMIFQGSGIFTVEDYSKSILEYEILDQKISDDFIIAETRKPTSGKGLAFVVEAAIAISPKLKETKKASQSLMRYVNRTPKLRDNADCAIWKAVQEEVNWKLYKLNTFDNGMPKGQLILLVNVSGPYVHLMFKSQSKNALAEDKVLIKELKLCLQALGRRIRTFQNKKSRRKKEARRSETISKFIPIFLNSLVSIAKNTGKFPDLHVKTLEQRLLDRLDGKLVDIPPREKKKESPQISVKDSDHIIEDVEDIEETEDNVDVEGFEDIEETGNNEEVISENHKIERAIDLDADSIGEEGAETKEDRGAKESDIEETLDEEELVNLFQEKYPNKKVYYRGNETKAFLKFKEDHLSSLKTSSTTSIKSSKPIKSSPTGSISIEERLAKARSAQKSKSKSTKSKIQKEAPRKIVINKPAKKKATSQIKKSSTSKTTKITQRTLSGKVETPSPKRSNVKRPKTSLNLLTDKQILEAFQTNKWYNLKALMKNLHITDMSDARFLLLKLRTMERNQKILMDVRNQKKYYKKK